MTREYYKTKFGALLNIISNRNYSTSLSYKLLYFSYYFIMLSLIFLLMFDKWHLVLAVLAAIIFVMNGKKYEDKELHITEYLPILYRTRVSQIYFTTYLLLIIAVLFDYIVLKYGNNESNIMEQIYLLFTVIIFSNLAIIQMILTKRSFLNFVVMDGLIFTFTAGAIKFIINGKIAVVINGGILEYINTDFSIRSIVILTVVSIILYFISVDFIVRERRLNELSKTYRAVYIVLIIIVFSLLLYLIMAGYSDGFKMEYMSN